ncbi:MAG: tRNA (guanosine(37)-N1)-methyltransferase TrmD [Acidobacteria bacterium]|nr:tRNA (guanosine(37)-N1)-methyltransferase TrmD [Acidobacteriota bacterium]
MRFDVITLFPDLFGPFATNGIMGRAIARGLVDLGIHDLRAWAENRWGQVDDEPYGGGAGMVIQAPPVLRAVRAIEAEANGSERLIMLSPRGRVLDQELVGNIATSQRVILLCGRYEGFDERVNEILEPEEVSIGDFILGGGEVAAMVVIEAAVRLLPGVVGDPQSIAEDSFSAGLLDFPAYTRPADVEGHPVPEVLRSGNHGAVRRWRLERAVELTVTKRPDLITTYWRLYSEEVREIIERLAPALARAAREISKEAPEGDR